MATIGTGSGIREFADKRALVTGGTRGIGAAIVRQLLDAGAEVLTTARSATIAAPAGASFIAADVRTRAGVEALAESANEVLGEVDILVDNAGGAHGWTPRWYRECGNGVRARSCASPRPRSSPR